VTVSTGALVGTAGGVGTTRLAIEVGAALAADGRDGIVVDAALDTQGLGAHVSGRLDPDVSTLLTESGDLADGLVDYPLEVPGSLRVCPAHAPFTRVAAAKAPQAAERLADLIREATTVADHVLVDVPPLASNTAVAGAAAADRRALVVPATTRGRDALSRSRGSLADLGLSADLIVANRAEDGSLSDADLSVPASRVTDVPERPACLAGESGFGSAVGELAEFMFGISMDVDLGAGLTATARDYLP
jgi:septum site-determining protein MinD